MINLARNHHATQRWHILTVHYHASFSNHSVSLIQQFVTKCISSSTTLDNRQTRSSTSFIGRTNRPLSISRLCELDLSLDMWNVKSGNRDTTKVNFRSEFGVIGHRFLYTTLVVIYSCGPSVFGGLLNNLEAVCFEFIGCHRHNPLQIYVIMLSQFA